MLESVWWLGHPRLSDAIINTAFCEQPQSDTKFLTFWWLLHHGETLQNVPGLFIPSHLPSCFPSLLSFAFFYPN
jgi:hypothetical protein